MIYEVWSCLLKHPSFFVRLVFGSKIWRFIPTQPNFLVSGLWWDFSVRLLLRHLPQPGLFVKGRGNILPHLRLWELGSTTEIGDNFSSFFLLFFLFCCSLIVPRFTIRREAYCHTGSTRKKLVSFRLPTRGAELTLIRRFFTPSRPTFPFQ